MLDPRPRTLATAAGVVLVGALAALGVTGPERTSESAGATTDAEGPDAEAPADAPTDASDVGAGGGADPDDATTADDEPPAGKGGGSLSPTESTLQQMRERDLRDAVDTYQELGSRD